MTEKMIPHTSIPNPLNGLVRFNQFAQEYEFTRKAVWHNRSDKPKFWEDKDTLALKLFFNQQCEFVAPTQTVLEGMMLAGQRLAYHPIIEYLHSVKWDGVPRLDNWMVTYLGAENTPYVRTVGKNTLIAACARVIEPGCKYDYLVILEGKQGTGKSTAVSILGGEHYLDPHLDLRNMRDAVGLLDNGWIVELAEMEFARKSDNRMMKAFMSRRFDKVRPAYARFFVDKPRQCIFIATYNPDEHTGYLEDTTGNRRYLPIATTKIDLVALKEDRDQLFAEAFHRYKDGEEYYIKDGDVMVEAETIQGQRMLAEPFEEPLRAYLKKHAKTDFVKNGFDRSELAQKALGINYANYNVNIARRMQLALRKLGFKNIGGREEKYVHRENLAARI